MKKRQRALVFPQPKPSRDAIFSFRDDAGRTRRRETAYFRSLRIRHRVAMGQKLILYPRVPREIVAVYLRLIRPQTNATETITRGTVVIDVDGLKLIEICASAMERTVRLRVERMYIGPPFGIQIGFKTRQPMGDDDKHLVEVEIVTQRPPR